jgi:hypothetical protein
VSGWPQSSLLSATERGTQFIAAIREFFSLIFELIASHHWQRLSIDKFQITP